LHATSHALQPMHTVVSVKNPVATRELRALVPSALRAQGVQPTG
jgi:hypothetical protein